MSAFWQRPYNEKRLTLGLFLLKELWFSNYAKSDLRYTCGGYPLR
jgi:hypothetical protein